MKKLMSSFLVIVMIFSLSSAALASSFTVLDMSIAQDIGYTQSEWLENDVMRALLVIAVGMDIMASGIDAELGSDLDFERAYTGKYETAVVVQIPSMDRDECLVVMYAPGDPSGVYRIIYNDFTDSMMLSMAKGTMTNYAKVDAEILKKAIEQLLGE